MKIKMSLRESLFIKNDKKRLIGKGFVPKRTGDQRWREYVSCRK